MVSDIPTIQPFTYQASTAFQERVQLADKLNEVIDALNNLGDLPDLESQITELKTKVSELEESIGNTDTSLAELENQVNALISEVNTTIKQSVSVLESEVDGIDARLTTAEGTISEHGREIDGLLKEVVDGVVMTSSPHGTIQVQINHEDGSNDISAPIDLGLVEEGGIVLQSGTTDRSFKLIVTLTDGTSWQTNDFVIPEGGGTEVSVTSISIAQGTGTDKIQVKIGLSDGSTISSNDWTVVTPSEFSALGTRVTTAEGKITKNTGDISDLDTRVQTLEDSPGYALQPATATILGGVKIGAGIIVQGDGTISVDKTQINTAAVASTVMFTADASKVTLHTDSIAGSEFTKDIPQASQGGAGTIDQASYAKIASTEARLNALAPTVTVDEEADPPRITVKINGKSSTANLPNGGTGSLIRFTTEITGEAEFPNLSLLDISTANASEYFSVQQGVPEGNSATITCLKDFAIAHGGAISHPGIIIKKGFKTIISKPTNTMDNFLIFYFPLTAGMPGLQLTDSAMYVSYASISISYRDPTKFIIDRTMVGVMYNNINNFFNPSGSISLTFNSRKCTPVSSKAEITGYNFNWTQCAFLG